MDVSADLDTRQVSNINLAESTVTNTSIGEAARHAVNEDVYALVPVSTNLKPQPPTIDDEANLDHSKYKEILTSLLPGNLDAKLAEYREERAKSVSKLEAEIEELKAQLALEQERQIKAMEAVRTHREGVPQE